MLSVSLVCEPFVKVAIDIVGPIQNARLGYKYIYTIVTMEIAM